MRIRVPGRTIAALAILTAFLCLLPPSTKVAVARPIGWEDVGPPTPPSGDNDGVVLKGKAGASPLRTADTVAARGTSYDRISALRMFLSAMKLDYWLFWSR